MSIFRSVNMIHKKIRIPREHAVEFMDELGKNTEGVEFINLNKNDQEGKKNFYGMIKRCDDVEKKIQNFERVCERYKKEIFRYSSYQNFILDLELEERAVKSDGKNFFDNVETLIAKEEANLVELISSFDNISEDLDNIKEKKAVYDKISQLISLGNADMIEASRGNLVDDEGSNSGIGTIAGVVKAEDEVKMKRMIFRISRGRATPTFFDLEIRASGTKEKLLKKIFTIFFPGGQENVLMQKLVKVCDIYNASRFNIPKNDEIMNEIRHLQSDIKEKEDYLKSAKTLIEGFLKEKVGSSYDLKPAKYDLYKLYIKKEKYIYNNLNKCVVRDNFIHGEIWATEENFPKIEEEIQKLSSDLSMSANFTDVNNSRLTPPTYIKSNDLTWVYQQITDAYGVPRYGEINPSLFSIITFPFLFGIMFGDIGHGGLLLIFALYLIFWADDIRKSGGPLKMALKVRYLLLLMGISAHFMGWIYNDFLSIPFNIFGSCYVNVSF